MQLISAYSFDFMQTIQPLLLRLFELGMIRFVQVLHIMMGTV